MGVPPEDRPRRFGELREHIRDITPKVLTETLRSLEADGLVSRHEYDENPPRVEYALTPLGRSLLVPLRAVPEVNVTWVALVAWASKSLGSPSTTSPTLIVTIVVVVSE